MEKSTIILLNMIFFCPTIPVIFIVPSPHNWFDWPVGLGMFGIALIVNLLVYRSFKKDERLRRERTHHVVSGENAF